MAVVVLTGLGFFLGGWRNGQFKDVEEAKYRMLNDPEPAPWPGRNQEGGPE
jgi:cbb3-type cytochrome oxidase maturation protein